MKLKTLTFTEAEEKAMAQLLDLAVKGGGLPTVQNVSHFVQKFNEAEAVEAAPIAPEILKEKE